jgi:hypothetical protein
MLQEQEKIRTFLPIVKNIFMYSDICIYLIAPREYRNGRIITVYRVLLGEEGEVRSGGGVTVKHSVEL